MAVIALDDTDSRREGCCTTYLAARIASRLEASGAHVERVLLVRLAPSVPYKTRGNAALSIHADCDVERAAALLADVLSRARTDDPDTNPGAVVFDGDPATIAQPVVRHARAAVRREVVPGPVRDLAADHADRVLTRGSGRGVVGALAAAGAWRAFSDWTYELIAYRERERWGTDRAVTASGIARAADARYPDVWDTYDVESGYPVCVPQTPCPVLCGIRGDDPSTVSIVARDVASDGLDEPVADRQLFVTNQGTDAHLVSATPATVRNGRGYRVTGTVVDEPTTRAGGHVHTKIAGDRASLSCVAFEPTKRFRDHVRALRPGDRVTVCGEVSDGTCKLEKFAVRSLVETVPTAPTCPGCANTMKSAGRGQGYRCRDCSTTAATPATERLDRALEPGWYEVPPVARRHVAKPLARGGFDAPVHPAR